jgi:GAF domain-containing protein
LFELNEDNRNASGAELVDQAQALLSGQNDRIANAANLSALLFHFLEDVNWVGFYFLKGDQLVVGPFQGKPACVHIPLGKGVCGKAASSLQTLRVADVLSFEGHIACDADSRSEIVIPLVKDGELLGVLDIDSPLENRFDEDDERFLAEIAQAYIDSIE